MKRAGIAVKLRGLATVLLLSACGSQGPSETDSGTQPDPSLAAQDLSAGAPAEDPALLQAKAARAIKGIITDPKSARYAKIRSGVGGAICGEVDSKQSNGKFGGFKPFVVTPDGVAVVSNAAGISFADPDDLFPDFYIRWCASPEELQTLGPDLQTASIAPGPADLPQDLPDVPELYPEGMEEPSPPPPARVAPARSGAPASSAAQTPAAEPGSFADAVIRKRAPEPGQ